jgi:hypothetical protein
MTLYVWGSNSDFWSSRTDWTPTGTPNAVTDEAEFTTPGSYTVTVDPSQESLLDALVLDDPDAELDVRGTLRFAGVDNTLALDAGTLLVDSGGVIQGATIESNGGSLGISGGTFDAVTYQGELDLPNYAYAALTTENGLTVEGTGGTPGGSIVFGYNSTLNVTGGLTVGTAGHPGSIELTNYYGSAQRLGG